MVSYNNNSNNNNTIGERKSATNSGVAPDPVSPNGYTGLFTRPTSSLFGR
jgi:hypothetical protein